MKEITNQMAFNSEKHPIHRRKKRLYIVNRTRFVLMSLITLIILSTIISYISGLFISEATTQFDTIEIQVVEGDTLWQIASEYNYYNEDIRDVIHRIKAMNDMKKGDIVVGQNLIIPVSHN